MDKIKWDVLQLQPFSTVEQAYAHLRREDVRQTVMTSKVEVSPGSVMATKGIKTSNSYTLMKAGPSSTGKQNQSNKPKMQTEDLKCTHSGYPKHTRETCFKLHGYPDWWNDFQARKKCDAATSDDSIGKVAIANAELSLFH